MAVYETSDARLNAFEASKVRMDFPILTQKVHGKQLVYLDNGATSQKPLAVIRAMEEYYREYNSNVHRGLHSLSDRATLAYESTRDKVQKYINAPQRHEVIFTKGTTESINVVANGFGRAFLKAGDEILISGMEHHANIVPWHLVAEYTKATVKAIPLNEAGELDLDEYESLITERTRIVAVNHVSNTLGTINPVKKIIEIAHSIGVPVLVDGAQALPHLRVDVRELDADFYAFSAHKMFGPTGTGILYGKEKWLDLLPPFQGGGDTVTLEKTTFNELPYKFEAGTPNIAGVVGLGAAIDYLGNMDWEALEAHEQRLLNMASEKLLAIPGLRIVGTAKQKVPVISFVVEGIHPGDIGTLLDH
jgi:cysteine desulfurase / selenocysteine lyase